MRTLAVALILVCFGLSSLSQARSIKCAALFATDFSAIEALQLEALVALKYDRSVAERLVTERPDVAAVIMSLPKNSAKPVTVYRGLQVHPAKYKTSYTTGDFGDDIYVADNISNAAIFGGVNDFSPTGSGIVYTTILQFQIPRYLLHKALNQLGGPEIAFHRDEIPDDSPFILNVGALRNSRELVRTSRKNYFQLAAKNTTWIPYDQAFRNGRNIIKVSKLPKQTP